MVFDEYGPATAMRSEEVDRPQPGAGEVLVQVLAAGVSHMDAYVLDRRRQDELRARMERLGPAHA